MTISDNLNEVTLQDLQYLIDNSLTALTLANLLETFYIEEGDRGMEFLQLMWQITKQKQDRMEQ